VAHRSSGLHRVLDRPRVYERFQRLLGAHAARRRLVDEFLRPYEGARLLDVGCGTGSLLDYLPRGVDYVGFDLNAAYIAEARTRYAGRGSFFCARVGGETVDGTFDFVVAKSLLHHLSDQDAHSLLATAGGLLRDGGVFFSSDPVRHQDQPLLARMLVALDRGRNVRWPEAYAELVRAHFPAVETTLMTDLLPIPYSHFVMRAENRKARPEPGLS
jgi:SAM-dependent methyltransferase